jgi:hypothetical protein
MDDSVLGLFALGYRADASTAFGDGQIRNDISRLSISLMDCASHVAVVRQSDGDSENESERAETPGGEDAMNSRLSIFGLLLVVVAIVAVLPWMAARQWNPDDLRCADGRGGWVEYARLFRRARQ